MNYDFVGGCNCNRTIEKIVLQLQIVVESKSTP